MFTYLKSINAHCGAAEPEIFPVESSALIIKGSVCELSGGYLKNTITAGKPKYVTIEEKAAGDGKSKIRCLRVLPGMLFEVDFVGDSAMLNLGELLIYGAGGDGCYIYAEDGENGTLELVDASDYKSTGKVTVSINW